MNTSVIENARQVIRDGHVCGAEDGENVYLFWVAGGDEVSPTMSAGIIQLLNDDEAVFVDETAGRGLQYLALVDQDDRETISRDCD